MLLCSKAVERAILIATICLCVLGSLGRLGHSFGEAIGSRSGSLADSQQAVPSIGSRMSSALQLLGGVLRKMADGATATFAKVDTLPEPGSDLFEAAQRALAMQLRTQGYAIVDLRASNALLSEYRVNRLHREANLASWFNQLADVRSQGVRLQTSRFGFGPEEALKTGTFHWHPDGLPFTALWQVEDLGTQIILDSPRWAKSRFDAVADASSRAYVNIARKTNLGSLEEKFAVVQRYEDLLDEIEPGLWRRLEEGSVFTEPGELLVFLGQPSIETVGRFSPPPAPGQQLSFGPMLHRRAAERLNGPRKLWIARGTEVRIDEL